MDTNSGFQSSILHHYTILSKITSYLDAETLNSVEKLTPEWASLVNRERLHRSSQLSFHLWTLDTASIPLEESTERQNHDRRKRRRPSQIDGTVGINQDTLLANKVINDISASNPGVVLFFTLSSSTDFLNGSLTDTVSNKFSRDTAVISIVSSDGIIGTDDQTCNCIELQRTPFNDSVFQQLATSCLVIPRRMEFGSTLLEMGVTEPPEFTKLVLLFQTSFSKKKSGSSVVKLSPAESKVPSDSDIWYIGGITHRTYVFQSNKFMPRNHVEVALHGESLRVFPCVLPSNVVAAADMQQELTRVRGLAAPHLIRGRCCAIVFVCCMRGYNMHTLPGLESAIFQKIFPEVPLVGSFTGGEIYVRCSKFVPLVGKVSNSDLIGFSSVFCILAW